ncbi:hypothetical protein PMIN07_010136 [Paraphaeosphaeria minitans]
MAPQQKEVERVMLDSPTTDNLRHWSKSYSEKAHLAGDLEHAERIRDLWRSYGITTELERYDVLQNFPTSSALELRSSTGDVLFKASLEEEELPEDPTSLRSNGLPAFHGFSANGDVQAKLVYANFGTPDDFANLKRRGIEISGKIVICKYAKIFRGLKVRAAQEHGAVGVIMYNDPQEDGKYTTKNGYEHFPHGPARHPSSIQRGSVDFFSVAVGDPTTPGYPSLPSGTERRDPHHAIPTIPSLPISFAEAKPFLKALNGQGLAPDEMSQNTEGWLGELDDVDYFTGPSKEDIFLSSQGDFRIAPIYNVIGTIEGNTEKSVVLGNHHDSWCCGAIDPISGSAAMNEVARAFGILLSQGWKPYRKIILASWDNEEYGLVGSTEWVEHHASDLSENCIAYINVDESTNGGRFLGALGSPLLDSVIRSSAAIVPSPINDNKTVYDDWLEDLRRSEPDMDKPSLELLGTGSDYTAFAHHLGIPSVDMLFNRQGQGVYPYHSNYDSYYWIDKFGDVGFQKHKAMAQLWGLVAVRLACAKLIPFDVTDYPAALSRNFADLREQNPQLTTAAFEIALNKFMVNASKFQATINGDLDDDSLEKTNLKLIALERAFLLEKEKGLKGRPWYRHQVCFEPSSLL